jgi:uncharacterized membrane protein YccC
MTRQVQTQEAFKLALSMTLFYWLALWMNWDMPKYGGLAIALISLGTTGASLHKGVLRLVGTTAGLAVGMLGLALFAQDRWGTLLFLTSYLTIISYFMQTSRYSYAWYVAGFLAPLVWSAPGTWPGFWRRSCGRRRTARSTTPFTMPSSDTWRRPRASSSTRWSALCSGRGARGTS